MSTTVVPAPSHARRQARAAAERGRPPRRDHPGEVPGQLDVFDTLAELDDNPDQDVEGVAG